MTTDPLAWVRAEMDAAEKDALAATRGPWETEGNDPTDDTVYSICENPDLVGQPVAYARGKNSYANMIHIARHHPAAVLRRIAAERKVLDDLLAETHTVCEDPWYTCGLATDERDGGECIHETEQGRCTCGRDDRVEQRVRLIAEGWGWTEETT